MVWFIFSRCILYISLFVIAHLLWNYLKEHMFTKKDLAHIPNHSQKYKEIIHEIQASTIPPPVSPPSPPFLSPEEKAAMIAELQQLLL